MSKKVINFQGRQVKGTSLDFSIKSEDWNVYKLADGTILKMKAVVSEVVRIDGEFDPAGEPIYTVKSQNILNADVPQNLKLSKPTGGKN